MSGVFAVGGGRVGRVRRVGAVAAAAAVFGFGCADDATAPPDGSEAPATSQQTASADATSAAPTSTTSHFEDDSAAPTTAQPESPVATTQAPDDTAPPATGTEEEGEGEAKAEDGAAGAEGSSGVESGERADGDAAELSSAEETTRPWSVFEVVAPPDASGRVYGAYDPYYTQAVAVGSLHVIADAAVDPEALQRTAYIITQMLANRPDVIEQLARWTYVVVGKTQLPIRSVPEVRALPQQVVEDWEVDFDQIIGGGWGPSVCMGCEGGGAQPFTMVSEANVLCSGYPTDTHTTEDVVVHELVHGIHSSFEMEEQASGLEWDDPATFDAQLQRLYEDAIASGIWDGHYAATNNREYFAEMFQYWSGTNDNDYVWTMTLNRPFDLSRQRDELAAYDPAIAEFLAEHFGEVAVTASCHYYQ